MNRVPRLGFGNGAARNQFFRQFVGIRGRGEEFEGIENRQSFGGGPLVAGPAFVGDETGNEETILRRRGLPPLARHHLPAGDHRVPKQTAHEMTDYRGFDIDGGVGHSWLSNNKARRPRGAWLGVPLFRHQVLEMRTLIELML